MGTKIIQNFLLLLLILAGSSVGFSQNNDDAITTSSKSKESVEKDQYYERGIVSLKDRNIIEACTFLEKAVENDPGNKEKLATLAEAYLQAKKYDKAEEYCKKSISQDENYARAHRKLGRIYSRKGNPEKALEAFEKACKSEPTNAWNFNNAGFMLIKLERYNEAVIKLEKAVELDPAPAVFQMNLDIAKSLATKENE